MLRSALPAVVLGSLFASSLGCGGAPAPTGDNVWHRSALRPGRVPPTTQGERELLAHLSDVPVGERVTFSGQVFVAGEPYAAASGRRCRSVTVRSSDPSGGARVKLACKGRAGWNFVPDVFEDGAPSAPTARRAP